MATITVGPSGRDYTSIQDAVGAAANGDTIAVYAGTYTRIGTGAIVDGPAVSRTGIWLRPMEAGVILDGQNTNRYGVIANTDWTIGSPDYPMTVQNTALWSVYSAGITGNNSGFGPGGPTGVTIQRVILDTIRGRPVTRLGTGTLVDRCTVRDCTSGFWFQYGTFRRCLFIGASYWQQVDSNGTVEQCGMVVTSIGEIGGLSAHNGGGSGTARNNWIYVASGTLTNGVAAATHTNNAFLGAITTPIYGGGAVHASEIVDATPTIADYFTDAGAEDFSLPAGSPLIGAGADLSASFTTDIDGTAYTTWDIGPQAAEYVALTGVVFDSMTSVTVSFDSAPASAVVENTTDWTVVSTSGAGAVSVTAVSVDGTDVTLTLSGLARGHDYTVTAVNSGASPDAGTFSTPVAVDSAELTGLTAIVVTFDGTPDAGDVENTADWTVVSTTGGGTVTVTAVSVDGAEVTLTVSGLARGHSYTVTSVNAGASPAAASITVPVALVSAVLTGPTGIVVTFEGTPTAADVQYTSDWTVTGPTGAAAVTVTAVSVAGNVVTLTTSALSSGYTYTVTAVNSGGDPDSDGVTYVAEVASAPSATERWVASEAQRLFHSLLPGNRVDPVQNEVLLHVFEAWARLRAYGRVKMIGLRGVRDPFDAPDAWLPRIGSLVLLTPDTGIPAHLSAAQWRALIPSAGAMWRAKGVDLRPILVALQGRPVWIAGWHDVRHVLDVTDGLPLMGYDAADDDDPTQSQDARTLTVHMADPIATYPAYTPADGEAAIDRDLVRLLIDAIRPAQQRVDVYFVDWLDDFTQGLGQWTSIAGRVPGWDPDACTMTLDAATDSAEVIVQQVAGDVAEHFEYATWEVWITLEEAVRTEIRLRHDGTDYYEVRITPSASDATAGAIALLHTDAGSMAAFTAATIPLGQRLFVRVTCTAATGGDDTWTVDLDGDRVLTATLAPQDNTGPMQFRLAAGQAATVQLVEQYQAPADTIRIGPED